MKALILILLLIGETGVGAFYPQGFLPIREKACFTDPGQQLAFEILPSSRLSIQGATNVNQFTCQYCDDLYSYTPKVSISKTGQVVYFKGAQLRVKASTFDCGIRQMNKDFQDLLKVNKYPYLEMELLSAKLVKGSKTEQGKVVVSCMLNLAGTQKKISFPLQYTFNNGVLYIYGQAQIKLPDFNIEPPKKMMGLVKVKESISVDFDLQLALRNN